MWRDMPTPRFSPVLYLWSRWHQNRGSGTGTREGKSRPVPSGIPEAVAGKCQAEPSVPASGWGRVPTHDGPLDSETWDAQFEGGASGPPRTPSCGPVPCTDDEPRLPHLRALPATLTLAAGHAHDGSEEA